MDAGAMGQVALELRDVSISLGDTTLVELSLTLEPGAVATVMGPSGVGKSTLLAWMCGTLDSVFTATGRVILEGRDITDLPAHLRRVGILFQDDLLFPHLSVGGNLAFALPAALKGKAARRARVAEALAAAGLEGFANRDPTTLSGGQRARVAVMRVLLSAPRLLLLDEPFSKLDATTRQQFRAFVFDQARAAGLPVLMVTHDPDDANAAGGTIVTL